MQLLALVTCSHALTVDVMLPLSLSLLLLQCDVIIDESYEMSTGGLTEMDAENPDGFLQTHDIKAYASQIPAVNEAQVYTLAGTIGQTITNPNSPIRGSVGLDWFERGVSRCDEVRRGHRL